MSVITTRTSLAVALAVGALALSLTGCGSSGSSKAGGDAASSAAAGAPMAPSSAASMPATGSAMADQPFGAACSAVPATGAGSFAGMGQDPVATAASNNPLLSTLVTAVKAAGLVDTLNSAKDITVFAPTNDAFAKLPKADLDKVLADKALLTKILTYHVSPSRLSPDALAGTQKTLEGSPVTVTGSGQDFTVNSNAKVLCGNVHTANATVYIIDTVLMPPTS
ncbi:fasciclin [Streptomyces tateyamensis]|uniref:Fasciclin n=1 Tax=Streptomyces tateyamensis TaxID=565073 RepID=A0A2V4NL02_9ACTN|nr:fasciclin domain-containing protein [Streptomyces tateyamensis]PYC76273.1 fasciclin [Streptomyces tateyamensis]